MASKLHVKTDDNVIVITGKDRGKKGKIIKSIPAENRVIVADVNMVKKHQKARGQNKPAAIIEREAAIEVSNVMLVCPKCNEPTRVSKDFTKDGTKVRKCKKCGAQIDKAKKTSGKGE
ncbi:MAG: 50S ribosomal protein L24 [Clostridiaceae bacterium]|jgi:large subunit ribosomal protein L24|nr:50S ribosomal protein L24 [Clostridiaceae bacterium]